MRFKVFGSDHSSLFFALESIKERVDRDFDSFDFLLLSISSKYNVEDINYYIEKVFKTTDYAAFHAIDSFSNEQIVQGVVVAVFHFERDGKIDLFAIDDILDPQSLERTSRYFNEHQERLHMIIGGLCDQQLGFFIEKLSERLEYTPLKNIIGGISSGKLTQQFTHQKIIRNGFIILSFSNIEFSTNIALGFKPYGVSYTIDKVEGYKIYSVNNGIKISDILNRFFDGLDDHDIRYLWYCPMYLLDEEDGYVATMRTWVNIEDRYVEVYGPIKEGERFKFSFACSQDLLNESQAIALEAKKDIQYPEAIFNFSCIARQYILEDHQSKEPNIYITQLNAPLFGFFTFGEIGPDKRYKRLKIYNETSILLAMREQ